MCQKVSLERVNAQEKLYKRNSHTYVVKKKIGKTDNCSSNVLPGATTFGIGNNYKNWPKCQSKGCFYFNQSREVINHQFLLDVPVDTNVWITIEPLKCESEPDTALFILKEGDSTARHLISFIDHRDENDDTCLGTRLEAGKYILLPFTSGCRVQTNTAVDFSSKRTRLVSEKKEPSDQVELTTEYQTALKEIFDLVDLDNNGRLSRQEFTLFQWRACREEVQDDEWAALEATFELEDGELTLSGFMDAHLLEAENHEGKEDDLWSTLYAMGFNSNLKLKNAVPFLLQVYSEEAGVSLHIQSLKSGGSLLEKAICRCAIDRGCPSKVKNLNDLIMYTYATEYQAIIAVHNKAHSAVMVRLDCSSSQNCSSYRGTLDFTLKCLPKSVMVGHYLIPTIDKQPWQVNCIESVVK